MEYVIVDVDTYAEIARFYLEADAQEYLDGKVARGYNWMLQKI